MLKGLFDFYASKHRKGAAQAGATKRISTVFRQCLYLTCDLSQLGFRLSLYQLSWCIELQAHGYQLCYEL